MKQALKNSTAIVAVAAGKGGPGKSTTSLNIAVTLASQGYSVAVLDLDPQGSLDMWQLLRSENNKVEVAVAKIAAVRLDQTVAALKEEGVEIIVLDTPPHGPAIATAAVKAADLVVIPTRPSYFDAVGIKPTVEILEKAGCLDKARVLINQIPNASETRAQEAEEAVRNQFGIASIGRIGSRVAFFDSVSVGLGIVEYEPRGKSADEVRAFVEALKGELA